MRRCRGCARSARSANHPKLPNLDQKSPSRPTARPAGRCDHTCVVVVARELPVMSKTAASLGPVDQRPSAAPPVRPSQCTSARASETARGIGAAALPAPQTHRQCHVTRRMVCHRSTSDLLERPSAAPPVRPSQCTSARASETARGIGAAALPHRQCILQPGGGWATLEWQQLARRCPSRCEVWLARAPRAWVGDAV